MLFKFALLILLNAVFTLSEPLYEDEKRLYNFGLGKRGYTYVSQYKRLPVYNFGLGKRADGKNMYAFGLGKRDDNEVAEDELDTEKRAKGYDFGLGKRLATGSYNFGLGKKAMPQYSFGLGKRLGYYNFGLGKRQGKYAFGLGKKDKVYSFGLGKRYNYVSADDEDEPEFEDDFEEERRGKYTDAQKCALGLGKCENTFDDLIEPSDENESLSERQIRSLHYGFGLGKRSAELPVNTISQSESKESRQDSKISAQ